MDLSSLTPDSVAEWLLWLFVAANAVVNLTPTPRDNEWLAKGRKFIDMLALNWTKNTKES
jgi:hypothetical protein